MVFLPYVDCALLVLEERQTTRQAHAPHEDPATYAVPGIAPQQVSADSQEDALLRLTGDHYIPNRLSLSNGYHRSQVRRPEAIPAHATMARPSVIVVPGASCCNAIVFPATAAMANAATNVVSLKS